MVALASTRLDMCQTLQQTAEMNPSHSRFKIELQNHSAGAPLMTEYLCATSIQGVDLCHVMRKHELCVRYLPLLKRQEIPDVIDGRAGETAFGAHDFQRPLI